MERCRGEAFEAINRLYFKCRLECFAPTALHFWTSLLDWKASADYASPYSQGVFGVTRRAGLEFAPIIAF
jgi:hypothetical protein